MRQHIFLWFLAVSLGLTQLPTARTRAEASPAASAESETRAREAFQRGRAHYGNGEFDSAAMAFEEAYRLSARDALLYNLYLAYRDSNQQKPAAEALRSYLSRVTTVENRAQLEARLSALDAGIAARKAEEQRRAETAAEEKPAEDLSSPGARSEAPGNERYWVTPVVLMGTGAGLALGALATGLLARSKQSELDGECTGGVCPADLQDTADRGKALAIVTDVLLVGGLAVGATGALMAWLKRPASSEAPVGQPARASAGFICSGRACGGSLAVRF